MKEMKALKDAALRLAHTGENEAVRVSFSLAPFEEAFPGGHPVLLIQRRGDTQAYPAPLTVEGDTAYWTVTAADTAIAGFGQCELQWYAGDTLAKSDKFDFLVVQALEAGAEPPDAPSKRWFDAIQSQLGDLSDLTTKAKENLVAAINEAAKTGSGGAGSIDMQASGGYIQYSTDGGTTWENLIAVADLKGEPGKDGEPGEKGAPGEDGAPGKDGAGMDITGAAAGQIAKISAVDENGKPTAWTPVDMPSGGEKPLSLIASFDFTDNTASAFQETGLDGLTELIFLSTSITNGTTVDSGLTLTINDVPIAAGLVPIYKQGTNTSVYGEPWEVCRYNGAFWECLLCNAKNGSSAITTASSYAILNNRAIRDVGPAAKIRLHVPNPLYKPVAGALEVWGR